MLPALYTYIYIFVNVGSNLLFKHVSLKERWLLRRHVFKATFSTSRNFNFVLPYDEIRRITKDISAWMSFVILRILSKGTKLKFREVEKIALRNDSWKCYIDNATLHLVSTTPLFILLICDCLTLILTEGPPPEGPPL